MHIYLPIAEMSANVWIFLGMGWAVGFLSGLFGVGGGFLMTPLLIFSGIPPAVAVGTGVPRSLRLQSLVRSCSTGATTSTSRWASCC